MRLLCVLVFGASCLAAGGVLASDPSFDCSKAESSAEKAVCASEDLADLDRELARLYALAATGANIDAARLKELKAMQRGWIKGRDDCWKAEELEACVRSEYGFRIMELRTLYSDARAEEGPSSGPFPYVCDGLDAAVSAVFVTAGSGLAVLRWGDTALVLSQVPAGSGAKYEGDAVVFWTHGNDASLIQQDRKQSCRRDTLG